MTIRAARYFGPGGAGGGATTLTETASFFVFADDFDRPNNPVVGMGWVQVAPTTEILGNLLNLSGGGVPIIERPDVDAVSPNNWLQGRGHRANLTPPMFFGLSEVGGDSYQLRGDHVDTLLNRGGSLPGTLDAAGIAYTQGVTFVLQMTTIVAGALGFQFLDRFNTNGSGIVSLSATDANYTGPKKPQLAAGMNASNQHNDIVWCTGSPHPAEYRCLGMRVGLGDRFQIRDSLNAIVYEASEGAVNPGEAHIDTIGTGEEVPQVGFPTATLADAGGTVLSTVAAGGMISGGAYPGGQWLAV